MQRDPNIDLTKKVIQSTYREAEATRELVRETKERVAKTRALLDQLPPPPAFVRRGEPEPSP